MYHSTLKLTYNHVLIYICNLCIRSIVYRRFQETHASIDIGHLSVRQKTVLCNDAVKYYGNPQDVYRIPVTFVFRHSRHQVRLTRREADGLKTNTFSLFECPCDIRDIFGYYFIGKNHLKNTATIYKVLRIKSKTYYYPLAFVSGINRYRLAYSILQS